MAQKIFEQLPHTADLKMRAYGSTIPELFNNALIGMFTVIKPKGPYISYLDQTDQAKIFCLKFTSTRKIHVTAASQDLLLIAFLSECLYLSDIYNEVYLACDFSLLTQTELRAILRGTPITGFEVVEIKAVTYSELELVNVNNIWQATIVFDI